MILGKIIILGWLLNKILIVVIIIIILCSTEEFCENASPLLLMNVKLFLLYLCNPDK